MKKLTHVKEHDRLVPEGRAKPRMGRPPFEPTEEDRATVRTCAGYGMTQDEIKYIVRAKDGGIAENTLVKYFAEELIRGKAIAGMEIKQKLYNLAKAGNVAMICFYLKTQHGWTETNKYEMSGPNGTPLAGTTMLLVSPKTREEWEKAVAKRQAELSQGGKSK